MLYLVIGVVMLVVVNFDLINAADGEVVAEERLAQRLLGRIRSIAVDQRGLIYLGSDNGEVWRLRPE